MHFCEIAVSLKDKMNQYQNFDDIQLVHSGTHYFDSLEKLISESQHSIHFHTYIFKGDETGKRVVHALIGAASRGVKVFLLSDAFGSFPFPSEIKKELIQAGIHFRLYSPFFSTESILPWRRLHHKLVVCDGYKALIGGINIADKYNSINNSVAWLDYAVLIQGDLNQTLVPFCAHIFEKKKISDFHINSNQGDKGDSKNAVRFRRNDWIKNKNEIHKSYIEALKLAQSNITLVASYFLPGANFRKLLAEASQRGVKIKIIMAGKSDSYSVKLAENYLYDFYNRHHIELYEWNESVLHGKVMLVDESWATIGSYNLNFLSHYISIELNADIISPSFNKQLSQHFLHITHNYSSTFKLNPSAPKKNIFRQFLMWLAYNFFRLMMSIFVSGKRKT